MRISHPPWGHDVQLTLEDGIGRTSTGGLRTGSLVAFLGGLT